MDYGISVGRSFTTTCRSYKCTFGGKTLPLEWRLFKRKIIFISRTQIFLWILFFRSNWWIKTCSKERGTPNIFFPSIKFFLKKTVKRAYFLPCWNVAFLSIIIIIFLMLFLEFIYCPFFIFAMFGRKD